MQILRVFWVPREPHRAYRGTCGRLLASLERWTAATQEMAHRRLGQQQAVETELRSLLAGGRKWAERLIDG